MNRERFLSFQHHKKLLYSNKRLKACLKNKGFIDYLSLKIIIFGDILSFFTAFSPKSFLFTYLCRVNFGVTFPMLRKEW